MWDNKKARFTATQLALFSAAIAEYLEAHMERMAYGDDGRGKLKIVFDEPAAVKSELNNPEFIMGQMSNMIAIVIISVAAAGYPLPPFNVE